MLRKLVDSSLNLGPPRPWPFAIPVRTLDLACRREVVGETAHVARARAAPAVDRLTRVADGSDRVPAAEQRSHQLQLRMAGVLELVEQDDLVAGSLDLADLGVSQGDPGGDRHLVAVVDYLALGFGPGVGPDQRQQLGSDPLSLEHVLGRGLALGGRDSGVTPVQPVAGFEHVGRVAQVLGQLGGQVQHGGGDRDRRPLDRVHRAVVAGDDPGGELPGDRGRDQAQRWLQGFAERVVGDQAPGVGVVGRDDRLAVEVAGPGALRAGPACALISPTRRSASSLDRTLVASSAAAFLVNVSPSARSGWTRPFAASQTSLAAIVSLLPEPAPAITASGASGALMTAACSGVGSSTPSSRASWTGLNLGRGAGAAGSSSSSKSASWFTAAPAGRARPPGSSPRPGIDGSRR